MVLDDNVHEHETPFKHVNGLPPPLSRPISSVLPPSALLLKFIETRRDIANYR